MALATITVPTVLLVLPMIAAVGAVWVITWLWAWDKWVEPPLRRWMYRRLGVPADFDELHPEPLNLFDDYDFDKAIEYLDLPEDKPMLVRAAARLRKRG